MGKLQGLTDKFKIVNPDGTPTLYFINLLQGRGVLTENDHDLLEAIAALDIEASSPITGGGVLAEAAELDPPKIIIGHAESGVVPNTYGDTGFTPKITVDEFGHVTEAEDVPFSGGGSLVLIQEQILGANQTVVTFTAIPNTYKDLVLVSSHRGSVANAGGDQPLMLQFNNDTGNNYNSIVWSRFEASSQVLNTSAGRWGYNISYDNGNRWPSETTIYDYAGNSHKHWMGRAGLFGGGNFANRLIDGWWASNTAISEIDIFINGGGANGDFVTGSKFQLYGRV